VRLSARYQPAGDDAGVTDRGFLIVHGWENRRPPGHWQHWLADRLAADGAEVRYPQLPEPDRPVLADWLTELRHCLGRLRGEERVLICHSLAALLWFSALPDLGPLQADRILLVAPPAPDFLRARPAVAGFVPADLETWTLDPAVRRRVRLVASDDDPYCPGGAERLYAEPFGLDADILPGQGHLDLDAGYGPWPAVLAWCTDPGVRITAREP
jgi:predicted alpha/beta hydrolase family esterase